MSKSQITSEVPVTRIDTRVDGEHAIATGVARRRSRLPYIAATAVVSVLAVAGLGALQRGQAESAPTTNGDTPAPVDLGEVYGPTLAELQAEPVGCTVTLETGDTAAKVASEVLDGESPYGHAILRYINQQGEGTGSAEGMLMAGQEVDLPLRYCADKVDQSPQEG